MGKKDKKRKSSVSRSRRREKKEKKKAGKKRNTKDEKRRRKESERSESSPSKGKAKAKESESSEVEEAPAATPAPAMAALDTPLKVSGCQNSTISDIVKGTYFRDGSHHGKPVYKKKQEGGAQDDDDLDVLIYYWDDRDGDDNCGWWFSPSVGGEMVWAYHPSRKATTPPPAEWNVPHDGEIDKTFTVKAAPELAKKAAEKEEDEEEDEEEEEEEEEEDEEVPKPKEEARVEPEEPEPDLTGLSPEERELALQEAEDRRLMQQLKQRELERKRKAEELRLKKEQEQKALEADEKKKKKQKDKEQKKKDKEEKKRKAEEEERQREREEEDRRRRDEEERRRKKEEDDAKRRKEEEDKLRREEEERQEKEREERRRKREEEERQEEEKRRKKAKEDEERRRREEEREEEERLERERRREEEEEREREERRKRKEKEEKEEAERKEAERQKKEEERRKHEEKMQRKLDERRRGRSGDRRRSRDRDYRSRDRHRDRSRRSRRDRSRDRRREEDDKEAREAREKAEKEHAAARAKEKEQRAVQTVTSMFQRMKGISLSNCDALKADFERIMASELPYCGEKEAELRAEATKVTAEADESLVKLRAAHEEEMKRRAEEERLRLEQEAKKKRQQQANTNVLKALQKLQDATPQTWQALSADFQQTIQAELPETAVEQRENLQQEADRMFQYMEQLVKQMEQKQKEEEERERVRLEELRVKEQQTRQTVQELEQLLVKAEEEATKARQVTEQLYHLVNQGSSPSTAPRESLAAAFPNKAEEALRAARASQRLGQLAQQALETAWKALEQNRMQIFEVETLRHEVAHFVQRSEHRMQQAQMVAAQAVKMASESKERIGNTAAPAICDRKNGDIFRRYDQDEDGMLSANEVLSFCRLEYGFQLPQGNLDRILQHLAPAADAPGGVQPKKFHQLRTAVGIARFEVRAKKAKELKAGTTPDDESTAKLKVEFHNHLKQRQQQMEKEVEEIAWADLEKKIADVESTSASFVKAAADSNLPRDELQKFEANFDGALQQTRQALPGFVNQLRTLQQGALELSMKMEVKEVKEKETKDEVKEGKDEPMKEEKQESDGAKDADAKDADAKDAKDPKTEAPTDELKSLKDKLRTASLRLAKFEARLVLSERKASEGRKVTARILAHKVEELRLDVACQLRRCIEHLGGKATDLFQIVSKGTDEASVEEAQVFLKENNCEMEIEKLSKAFAACKSTPQDGSSGPVKVTREEFGRIIRVCYEVTKEVDFTETLALSGPVMRSLQVGEILEVQAGPRNEPSKEGIQRIHARAQLDGALGWATVSSDGESFLVKKPNSTS